MKAIPSLDIVPERSYIDKGLMPTVKDAAMLTLNKKTDYALIALADLARSSGRVASAREIADAYGVPVSVLMQILKTLHHHHIVESTRGSRGGYMLRISLEQLSLRALIEILESDRVCDEPVSRGAQTGSPNRPVLQALHQKLVQFLENVKVSDLVLPGRRIDVPWEGVRVIERVKVVEPQPVGTPA